MSKDSFKKLLSNTVTQTAIATKEMCEHFLQEARMLPEEDVDLLEQITKVCRDYLVKKTGTEEHPSVINGSSKQTGNKSYSDKLSDMGIDLDELEKDLVDKRRNNKTPDWNDL